MTTALLDATSERSLVDIATSFGPAIRAQHEQLDAQRRLPPHLAIGLAEAGLFKLLMPARYGGHEVDPATALATIEALAASDGSVGWLSLANVGGLCMGLLAESAVRVLLDANPDVVVGGTLVPSGIAQRVPGGYRVSGRWGFASGVQHSGWMMVGCVVVDESRAAEAGMRALFVRTDDLRVIDTWSVNGLRGTGSHDIVVDDIFVPEELSFTPGDPAVEPGPLYRFPIRSLGAAGIAAVCLGIARCAVDAFIRLATTKTPTMSVGVLGERFHAQHAFAKAEALVQSSRTWLYGCIEDSWSMVVAGDIVPIEQQARMRLAATNACTNAVMAVDLIHAASGGAGLFVSSPIERSFRDVHAAGQHFSVQEGTYELVARTLLGLPGVGGPPL